MPSKENDIQEANLAVTEFIADFLCFIDREGGAANEEHFESNLLVADLLLQSLGFQITDAKKDRSIVAEIMIGLS